MNVNITKQLEYQQVTIGENTFHIRPFAAFTAANISGEIAALLTPILGGVAAAVPSTTLNDITDVDNIGDSLMDMDIDAALPVMAKAFSGISGDKFEALMKKLLITHKNISVDDENKADGVSILTYDLANEIFCGDVQDMYVLCYHVIRINYKGFFKKVGGLFGKRKQSAEEKTTSKNTAPLTEAGSPILN